MLAKSAVSNINSKEERIQKQLAKWKNNNKLWRKNEGVTRKNNQNEFEQQYLSWARSNGKNAITYFLGYNGRGGYDILYANGKNVNAKKFHSNYTNNMLSYYYRFNNEIKSRGDYFEKLQSLEKSRPTKQYYRLKKFNVLKQNEIDRLMELATKFRKDFPSGENTYNNRKILDKKGINILYNGTVVMQPSRSKRRVIGYVNSKL